MLTNERIGGERRYEGRKTMTRCTEENVEKISLGEIIMPDSSRFDPTRPSSLGTNLVSGAEG
jgi:hypothetical protein